MAQHPGSRNFQRWLVIPCRHADSNRAFDLGKIRSTVSAVEEYWNAMAEWFFSVRGGYVLATGALPFGNDPVILPWTIADDAGIAAPERLKRIVDAALSMPNPNPGFQTRPERLWMDWRWFTGIVILKANGGAAGMLPKSPMLLPSGRMQSGKPEGHWLSALPYDVIEMSLDNFSHASLAKEIGRTLGFGAVDDDYDLMGPVPGPLQYTAPVNGAGFGSPDWGGVGPGVSSGLLAGRGWLADWMIQGVDDEGGGGIPLPTVGTVELTPLHRNRTPRGGTVRADIGPYSFELRVPSGWDSGIRNPVVLARDSNGPPTALTVGGRISWGGGPIEITGGGSVTVTALTADHATLSY